MTQRSADTTDRVQSIGKWFMLIFGAFFMVFGVCVVVFGLKIQPIDGLLWMGLGMTYINWVRE